MFCMGNPKGVKPDEIFPLYCDDFDEYRAPEVSEQETDEMLEMIAAENAKRKKNRDT